MNGTEPEDRSWTEKGNAVVRWALAIIFGLSVCYGFLFARIGGLTLVSSDAFSTIAMAVILWWFNKEQAKDQAKQNATLVAAATAPGAKPIEEVKPT